MISRTRLSVTKSTPTPSPLCLCMCVCVCVCLRWEERGDRGSRGREGGRRLWGVRSTVSLTLTSLSAEWSLSARARRGRQRLLSAHLSRSSCRKRCAVGWYPFDVLPPPTAICRRSLRNWGWILEKLRLKLLVLSLTLTNRLAEGLGIVESWDISQHIRVYQDWQNENGEEGRRGKTITLIRHAALNFSF